jgi:hypothetical protein
MSSPAPGSPKKPIGPKQPFIRNGKPELIVDPQPGNRVGPKPPKLKPQPKKPLPVKPRKPLPVKGKAYPMPSIDDDIVRMMPITSKQLGQIKKYYGI